jgi:hypothetical protein
MQGSGWLYASDTITKLAKYQDLRPKLDEILLQDPSKRPTSYHEAIAIGTMEGGVLWGTACHGY